MKKAPFIIFAMFLFLCAMQLRSQEVRQPKNIIVLIGDGMGFNHIKAYECYRYGQSDSGIFKQHHFISLAQATYSAVLDDKPQMVFSAGYNPEAVRKTPSVLKDGATDSGAAATALATGKKTRNKAIGMSWDGDTLLNLTILAKSMGKSAGVVSSVPLSHATPAGFTAHNSSRSNYSEIARDMLLKSNLDVLMGCGNPDYNNKGEHIKMNAKYVGGDELWEQITAEKISPDVKVAGATYLWPDVDGDNKPDPWVLLRDCTDFVMLAEGKLNGRILGVPKVYSTLQQERPLNDDIKTPFGVPYTPNVPTLKLMTEGALKALAVNSKGFFLMVEGGAIDWASHENQSDRMIEETDDFMNAVEVAISWVKTYSNWDETLLIVTSDHECGFLWTEGGLENSEDLVCAGKGNIPRMKWYSGDHTNSLVPFYAKGAGAAMFSLMADEYDPRYGYFIQNTELAQAIFILWGQMQK